MRIPPFVGATLSQNGLQIDIAYDPIGDFGNREELFDVAFGESL
jgi:hypothetical protein